MLNETLYLPKRHNSGFQVAKSCISPLDWKPASKQTWQAAWGKGAKGKEWTRCLCERCDCRSRFHSPNSMHLDSGLWFSADMMSSDALSALFFVLYRWIHRTELFLQLSLNPMGYLQLYLSLKELLRLLKGSYTHNAWRARLGGTGIATGEKSAGYTDKKYKFKTENAKTL